MEREIVHQSDSERLNQRDCSSSPHGWGTKSICQDNEEGQSCFVQGIGATIWGKINGGGHMALLKSLLSHGGQTYWLIELYVGGTWIFKPAGTNLYSAGGQSIDGVRWRWWSLLCTQEIHVNKMTLRKNKVSSIYLSVYLSDCIFMGHLFSSIFVAPELNLFFPAVGERTTLR